MGADKRADKLSTHAAKKSDAKKRGGVGSLRGWGPEFMWVARRRCKTFALNSSGANIFSIYILFFPSSFSGGSTFFEDVLVGGEGSVWSEVWKTKGFCS